MQIEKTELQVPLHKQRSGLHLLQPRQHPKGYGREQMVAWLEQALLHHCLWANLTKSHP